MMSNNRPAFEAGSIESALERLLNNAGVSESELLPHLDLRSLLRFSQSNRGTHGLFEKGHCKKALLDAIMSYLANIIVNEPTGKNITILILLLTNMLGSYPELLTRKMPNVVFKETGQAYINYSLLQLAFAEYDDELCCDAFEPLFERVFGSKEAASVEIRKQLDEKFPEESEEEKLKSEAEDKNQLVALLTPAKLAFANEQFNNYVRDADGKLILSDVTHTHITTVREAFDALQPKEIHKGSRFSLNMPLKIYEDYLQFTRQNNHNRYGLYADGFVSHMQRYIPQTIAMSCAQGMYYFLKNHPVPFARDITLRADASTVKGGDRVGPRVDFYTCLRQISLDYSLLVGSCVNIAGSSPIHRERHDGVAISITKLMLNKISKLAEFTQRGKEYPAAQPITYQNSAMQPE